jgi:hypothetical protein
MKAYEDFILTVVGGKWLASLPSHFTLRKRALGAHWTAHWMGLSTGLDDVETQIS